MFDVLKAFCTLCSRIVGAHFSSIVFPDFRGLYTWTDDVGAQFLRSFFSYS